MAAGLLLAGLLAAALPARAEGPVYDLLFRTGTLDGVPAGRPMIYDREVSSALDPDFAARESGAVELTVDAADGASAGGGEARLRFVQGERHRTLGAFPVSIGNPMIMYFMESVARDMAQFAGGSPFYIRNRLKEALLTPLAEAEVAGAGEGGRSVVLRPFATDPNRDRMGGFGDLELTVTMREGEEGWLDRMVAEVPGPAGAAPVYRLTLDHREPS